MQDGAEYSARQQEMESGKRGRKATWDKAKPAPLKTHKGCGTPESLGHPPPKFKANCAGFATYLFATRPAATR